MAATAQTTVQPATVSTVARDLVALAQRAEKAGATRSAAGLLDEARTGI